MTSIINQTEIGQRLRNQRLFLGYTKEDAAERIGVSARFYANIESGHKGMSLDTLCRVSDALNISTDYILTGKTLSGRNSTIDTLIENCPSNKISYLENIIRDYIKAIRE